MRWFLPLTLALAACGGTPDIVTNNYYSIVVIDDAGTPSETPSTSSPVEAGSPTSSDSAAPILPSEAGSRQSLASESSSASATIPDAGNPDVVRVVRGWGYTVIDAGDPTLEAGADTSPPLAELPTLDAGSPTLEAATPVVVVDAQAPTYCTTVTWGTAFSNTILLSCPTTYTIISCGCSGAGNPVATTTTCACPNDGQNLPLAVCCTTL